MGPSTSEIRMIPNKHLSMPEAGSGSRPEVDRVAAPRFQLTSSVIWVVCQPPFPEISLPLSCILSVHLESQWFLTGPRKEAYIVAECEEQSE